MKKKFMTLAPTAAMAASMGMTAFAGQWVQNTTGWWWQEDNGSYPVSQWKWLDGNKDGIYECYAFDSNGYIYTNTTTPDGYTVMRGRRLDHRQLCTVKSTRKIWTARITPATLPMLTSRAFLRRFHRLHKRGYGRNLQ
ncbi:MAG: hypothetical protein ACLR78_02880 [Roseburia sp.]